MGGRHGVQQTAGVAGSAPWGEPQPAYHHPGFDPGFDPGYEQYDPDLSFTPDLSWQPPAMRQQQEYVPQAPDASYASGYYDAQSYDYNAGYATGYSEYADYGGYQQPYAAPYPEPYAEQYPQQQQYAADVSGAYAQPQYAEPYAEQYTPQFTEQQFTEQFSGQFSEPAWNPNTLYDTTPQPPVQQAYPVQDASTAAPWDTPISLEYHHEAYHEPFLAEPYDPYQAYAIPEQRGYDTGFEDYQAADDPTALFDTADRFDTAEFEALVEAETATGEPSERRRGQYAPPEYIGEPEPKKDGEPKRESSSGSSGGKGDRPYASAAGSAARRRPAKRKGLALASAPVAVVGVAAVAAAAVGGIHLADDSKSSSETADPAPTATGLDSKLLQMRAEAQALADRASRAEQRTELAQQAALQRAKIEAMRPKFVLPVSGYILTAGFGQAGEHWQNLHTGQDFAVSVGTQVHAVEDGVVTAAGWDGAYGYRVVVTAADGTETWYCHLSAIKIRSGPVKAGTVIAYSGDTGNTTGPHLHFEVRIDGTPIDPMPWLRSHGLNP